MRDKARELSKALDDVQSLKNQLRTLEWDNRDLRQLNERLFNRREALDRALQSKMGDPPKLVTMRAQAYYTFVNGPES